MNTLSLFPQLLTFEIFSALILRIIASLFVINLGLSRYNKAYKWSSVFYFISGGLVFVGLYTQASAILGVLVLKFDFYIDYWMNKNTNPVSREKFFLYGMAILIMLSLLLTGPGAFAFDLPL